MSDPNEEVLLAFLKAHPLAHTIPSTKVRRYVQAGQALGEAVLARVRKAYPGRSAGEILEAEGVKIELRTAPQATGIEILCEFQAFSSTVLVYPERLESAWARLSEDVRESFRGRMTDIALAHEVYHYFWEERLPEKEREGGGEPSPLALLFPVPSERDQVVRSPVVQEIAAQRFSQALLGLSHCPALLALS